jgi:hypothetical protein
VCHRSVCERESMSVSEWVSECECVHMNIIFYACVWVCVRESVCVSVCVHTCIVIKKT